MERVLESMQTYSHSINVFEIVGAVLSKCDPILVVAFIGHYCFGISINKLASMLDTDPLVVKTWLFNTAAAVKREYRLQGGKSNSADINLEDLLLGEMDNANI